MSIGVAAAVAAAVGYAVSTLMQAAATRRAHGIAVVLQPLVVLALAIDGAAWLVSLLALDQLPVLVVQAIQGSSVLGVVAGAVWLFGARLRPVDVAAAGAVVAALVVLAVGAGDQPAVTPPRGFVVEMLVTAGVLVVAFLVLWRVGPAWSLAVLAGLGYGLAAVAARGAHAGSGLWDTVVQPLTVAIVVGGVVGTLAYLRALERGPVGPVAATTSVFEVIVPGAVGMWLLGDGVRPGWSAAVLGAAVVAVAACAVLAHSPANQPDKLARPVGPTTR